jgi:hypothetical protein
LPAFKKNGFHRWARLAFPANGLVMPLITFIYFYPNYFSDLLMFGIPWAVTAPSAMLMPALLFTKEKNSD